MTRVSWFLAAVILFGSQAAYAQQSCESLLNLKLPYTLITAAMSVPEGTGPAPSAPGAPPRRSLPYPKGRAGTSVWEKSSPLNSNGSPTAMASAYEKQSP